MQQNSSPGVTYEETLEYLYHSLPMFQRIGGAAFKKDLTNTLRLCEALGNPEKRFKSVHIAGTNGKGSSSHYLAAILQSAGYKTGLYTSPHLKSFTERIKLNGKEAEKQFVVDFVREHRTLIEEVKPSFFEITVVMAFEYFARHQVDIAVIEVGMGGRLDSTNVILPEVSLITNIGWDHQQWLGDTLEQIAREKAGIIKPYIPVVISEYQEEVAHTFVEKVKENENVIRIENENENGERIENENENENGNELIFASEEYACTRDSQDGSFSVRRSGKADLKFHASDLPEYQERNIPGVVAVCDQLNKRGFVLTDEAISHGLEQMQTLTGLKGRWQKLREQPDVYCDVAHNKDGLKYVLKQISRRHYEQLYLIWGVVNDKDLKPLLAMLPADAYYYFCQASIPRALEAEKLKEIAEKFNLHGEVIPDVNDALDHALKKAGKSDLIIIGGSNFVIAEIENL